MSEDWADKIAQHLLTRGLVQTGICLILGASDTGKTTLTAALAKQIAARQPVGIIDADTGQSHIGPPTTVGWILVEKSQIDFSRLTESGISFVGDVTPVGHLLQLTSAIVQCVRQASGATEIIIIDTPGFIHAPAAAALWWTVQHLLKPKYVVAVQRNDELSHIISGLRSFNLHLELIKSPPQIPTKSPQERRSYRQHQFNRYFQDSCLYNITLSSLAVQPSRNLGRENLVGRLVALRDEKGDDMAIGVITNLQNDRDVVTIKAPQVDIHRIRCLVIGDVTIEARDIADG